ncbi:aldolase [Labrenzia aggregata]|uniref:Aldolase n=1 Tax=Roseibium aggregatum TaxID=187304 RepID=A0A939EIP9_9HYPH|nr:aldolase [Roseibium aggregatum]
MARGAGFSFVVVDMEHGPLGISELGQMAAAGLASRFPVYGRVTGPGSPDVARVLDCGATGVIVPHVDSVEDARRVVRACRFQPTGARALPGPLPAFEYHALRAEELCDRSETSTQVIAMIESAAGLDAVEEIAATPGIDGLMIGSNDLADGIGLRGQLHHPDFLSACARISTAALANGCTYGIMGLPRDLVRSHALDLGATLVVATNETNLVAEGGALLLDGLRRETVSRVTP